jgi:hypothetical protein
MIEGKQLIYRLTSYFFSYVQSSQFIDQANTPTHTHKKKEINHRVFDHDRFAQVHLFVLVVF